MLPEPAGRTRCKRTVMEFVGLETSSQIARNGLRETRPYLPPEAELVAVVVANEQCAYTLTRALGIGESPYHELLAVNALRLDPEVTAARLVRCIGALGNDPFEAKLARLLEDVPAVADDMFRVADTRPRSRFSHEP